MAVLSVLTYLDRIKFQHTWNMAVLSVLTPKKIPTCIEHGHTKRTNVLTPNKIQTCVEHGY